MPEVELVVGKADGRTPTDPSPLDMVETVITLRPKEQWVKRKLDFKDATPRPSGCPRGWKRRGR